MRVICLLVLLAALIMFGPGQGMKPGDERAEAGQAPDQWFYQQRTYPFDKIPENALEKALRQKAALESARLFSQREGAEAVSPWTPLGPGGITTPEGPVSGRVTAVVTDSRNPEHLYIAAAGGGVWRSTDGGATWLSLGDNLLSLSSGTLVLDERINALYYGTGDASSNGYGVGILRSLDGGATWRQLSAQFSLGATFRIALHPQDPRTLLVARSSGLWRTTDGGDTWVQLLRGFATDLAVDAADSRLLFAALGRFTGAPENGVYRSFDGGNSWTLLPGLPSGSGIGRISLAESSVNPAVLYAVVARSTDYSLEGVYRSDDFGGSWRRLASAPASLFVSGSSNQGYFDNMIALDPRNPDRVYLGGVELYRSTDGGLTWTDLSLRGFQRAIHEDQFAVAFRPGNPDTIFVGNDGGMYRSNDGGDNWTNLNAALPITQFNSVAIGTGIFLGGTQDNGVIRLRNDAFTWEQLLRGDGGAVATDPFNSSVLFATRPRLQIFRSRDGGSGWSQIVQGIAASDRVAFFPPMTMEPSRPQNLLFGTQRLWRSADSGESWTAGSPDLSSGGFITALAVAASLLGPSRTFYAGTNDGQVFFTQDGGVNWQRGAGVPNRWITSIGVDPRFAARAYFSASSFGTGHVFRTDDSGSTWNDVSGNLPDAPASAVVVDARGVVYAATDVGVFRSDDGAGTWTSFNLGLPNTFVTALALDTSANTLVAGTYGRGAYVTSLQPSPLGPSVLARGVVNAASNLQVLAPGAIASVYGQRLAASTAAGSTLPVPTSLGGTAVTVNGIAAPLFFVSPQQINFQVPFEINTSAATVVVTTSQGSAAMLVQVAPSSPGIFAGTVARGGRPVDATNPAAAGDVLTLYATGLGLTTPAVASGAPGPAAPPAQAVLPVTVTIGSAQATTLFAGLAPTFVGLYQVNVVVPAGVAGDLTLVISSGGRSSNAVTIPVR